jgi:short-subunit dehydrogenase
LGYDVALPWKIVWVTGASTGIGAEICRQLAQHGVMVAASARSMEKLHALASENSAVKAFPLDVTDSQAVAVVFDRIERELGPVDLVIAAAGVFKPLAASGLNVPDFETSFRTNYMGVVNVLTAALPALRKRQAGHVSWVASIAGYRGLPKSSAYGPTKAALINLAESLKPDLQKDGIMVSVINPGFVRTPMTSVNEFPMPFIMEPEAAAAATIKGLARGKYEVAYPWQLVSILKLARLMPNWLFFRLVRTGLLD